MVTLRGVSPRRAYAVSWAENDGPPHVGKLVLLPTLVRLEGRGPGPSEVGRSTPYSAFASITSTHAGGYRRTLIALCDGSRMTLTSLDGPGALRELEDELRARAGKPHGQSGGAPMPADG